MDAAARAQQAVRYFTAQLPDSVRQQATAKGLNWPTSGLVYQYTSLATLFSMIRPDAGYVDTAPGALSNSLRTLWATSAPYMNDSREFNHGHDMIKAAVKRVRGRLAAADRGVADIVAQATGKAEGLDVFCACFSLADDHLGQWRGYGDNGRGCQLAFDLATLESQVNGLGSWLIYGDKADKVQRGVSDRLIQDLVDILRQFRPTAVADQVLFDQAAEDELRRLLPAVFLLFKDQSFRDEHEYRVVYSDAAAPRAITDANGYPRRWFRSGGPAVVPFVKLEFANSSPAPLRMVRLGPAAGWDTNVKSLERMLALCGLGHVTVEKSKIPFVPR